MGRGWLGVAMLLGACGTNKTAEPWPTANWPTGRPAEVGLDSVALASLDAEFAAGKHQFVDGMFITRRGVAVYEAKYRHDYRAAYGSRDTVSQIYNYYDPTWHPYYQGTDLHTLQSVSKTITSITFGIAKTKGDLATIDTAALAFFPSRKVANVDDRKRRMTIRHLMTMTAGLAWDETTTEYTDTTNNAAVMEKSRDWVQYVLDRPMAAEPGSQFVYNSGATELLAEIFKQATGRDLIGYAEANLFKPLGIASYYWKRTPLELPDTEGGLYLTPRDLAKIGFLFLKNGRWEGQQLVSPDWVAQSVTPATQAGEVKYGLKWWLFPYGPDGAKLAWLGLGYGGQRLIVIPEFEIVAVFTGWNIDEHPALSAREMLDRLVAAVRE